MAVQNRTRVIPQEIDSPSGGQGQKQRDIPKEVKIFLVVLSRNGEAYLTQSESPSA